MNKIVIFASSRGTNAEAIWKQSAALGYTIECIICDRPKARVTELAKVWKVPCYIFPKIRGEDRTQHEKRIVEFLKEVDFDLIVLAGYQRILSPKFLSHFSRNSVLNIHPSLLPLYPGQDAYKRAFADKVAESGCSIHFVDEGTDTGEIVAQFKFFSVAETEEEFEKQGLALEHLNYPQVIASVLKQERIHRVEIFPKSQDLFRGKARLFWIKTTGPCANMPSIAKEVLSDSVVEDIAMTLSEQQKLAMKLELDQKSITEISFLPGVTDNTAAAAREALLHHPLLTKNNVFVYSGALYFGEQVAANTWLEKSHSFTAPDNRFENLSIPEVRLPRPETLNIDLNITDDALVKLSKDSLWALNLEELKFVQSHFQKLKRSPTDIEMEIIAQTWSEHCKHKIFAATIQHEDEDGKREIKSLFKTFIRGATTRIIEEKNINWARSVFTDNAGIVRWDEKLDVCIKVETHNSPSALDPYGGALTGILGVNRDILGAGLGAMPIANTNVFCLPPENADQDGAWPSELHSPKKLRAGVHKGVQDGGNKSGIPTVNGAFNYDMSFAGKPLVYCGTIGVLPHKIGKHQSHEKNQRSGDLVVMVGGRIGKDGIHGATFSSEELKEGTPSTVVQIGDPLTQKRMTDFLLQARDKELYTSITDNGAGGLSSSVGEMAGLTNGARIDLALAPVKYPGLSAAELMISESQERMTCSVHPSKWKEFKGLAEVFGVEVSSLGEFTADGKLTVLYSGKTVAELELKFLHDDLPPMQLTSTWKKNFERPQWKVLPKPHAPSSLRDKVLALLTHPNIKSHEKFVRQYDHEVKAATCMKSFTPQGGPTDAAVIAMKPHGGGETNGVVISSGLAPLVSLQDTKLMAKFAVDEAVRNAVVTGADPSRMVLVDNFCWPDPLQGPNNPDFSQKLGELVRANEGLYEIATAWGMPFVSGKDSMKNDALVKFENQKTKISVLPTLLITAMANIPDVRMKIHSSFVEGDDLWLLGDLSGLNPYTLTTLTGGSKNEWSDRDLIKLRKNYGDYYSMVRAGIVSGAHDVSEGGALIALIEMAINSDRGFDLHLAEEQLFGEGMGLIAFSASAKNRIKVQSYLTEVKLIGKVRTDRAIVVNGDILNLKDCVEAYKGEA